MVWGKREVSRKFRVAEKRQVREGRQLNHLLRDIQAVVGVRGEPGSSLVGVLLSAFALHLPPERVAGMTR